MRSKTAVMTSTLLLILAFSSSSVCSGVSKREVNIDNAITVLLDDVNSLIRASGKSCHHINDIHQTFERKVRFMKIKGIFDAFRGQICDLSSITRTGRSTMSSTPTTVTIDLHVGLNQTRVNYLDYQARVGPTKVSGDIEVTTDYCSVHVQLIMYFIDDKCTAKLSLARIESLGDMKVTISGMRQLDWLGNKMAEWILNDLKSETMISRLEEEMRTGIDEVLRKRDLCQYLMYL